MSSYNVDMIPRAIQKALKETPQDPEWWYDKKANTPYPISELYQLQINKKLRQEARQRDQDLYKNSGQSWKNSPYPFMAYSGSYSGRYNYGTADYFEATQKIVSLYSTRWKKW